MMPQLTKINERDNESLLMLWLLVELTCKKIIKSSYNIKSLIHNWNNKMKLMKLQFYLISNIPLTNTRNLSTYRNNMHFPYIYMGMKLWEKIIKTQQWNWSFSLYTIKVRCIGTESHKSYEQFLIIKKWSKNVD